MNDRLVTGQGKQTTLGGCSQSTDLICSYSLLGLCACPALPTRLSSMQVTLLNIQWHCQQHCSCQHRLPSQPIAQLVTYTFRSNRQCLYSETICKGAALCIVSPLKQTAQLTDAQHMAADPSIHPLHTLQTVAVLCCRRLLLAAVQQLLCCCHLLSSPLPVT